MLTSEQVYYNAGREEEACREDRQADRASQVRLTRCSIALSTLTCSAERPLARQNQSLLSRPCRPCPPHRLPMTTLPRPTPWLATRLLLLFPTTLTKRLLSTRRSSPSPATTATHSSASHSSAGTWQLICSTCSSIRQTRSSLSRSSPAAAYAPSLTQ